MWGFCGGDTGTERPRNSPVPGPRQSDDPPPSTGGKAAQGRMYVESLAENQAPEKVVCHMTGEGRAETAFSGAWFSARLSTYIRQVFP